MPHNASFWQVGLFDVVLSEYPEKYHNFTNFIFYDVALEFSIHLDLRWNLKRERKQKSTELSTLTICAKTATLQKLDSSSLWFVFKKRVLALRDFFIKYKVTA